MPALKILGGKRVKFTATREVQDIVAENVGPGKRFSRPSQLYCFCVVQTLGSQQARKVDSRKRLVNELADVNGSIRRMTEQKGSGDRIGRVKVLQTLYNMAVDLELAEKAQADWASRYIADKDVAIYGPVKLSDGKAQAIFSSQEHILEDVLFIMQIQELQEKKAMILTELKVHQ